MAISAFDPPNRSLILSTPYNKVLDLAGGSPERWMLPSRCRWVIRTRSLGCSSRTCRRESQPWRLARLSRSQSIQTSALRRYNGRENDKVFRGGHGESSPFSHTSEATIFALSTAQGKAGIAVIRITGKDCLSIYHSLCRLSQLPKPRYAIVRTLYEPHSPATAETVLDSNAMILYFPGPASVTGEDVLELHVHGGPAIVKSVLAAIPRCASVPGAIRHAEAGEFTRRAFMNDKMDLLQVEALGDSLSAMTETQRRIAVRRTSSKLGLQYEEWRSMLLAARGEMEALIDFSEDQHFDESPETLMSSVAEQVRSLRITLEAHLQNAIRGELLRNGIAITLLGAPNAGKSSLLNRIVGREAAIVSTEAGTTRDVVEVLVDIGGFLCRFGDTAGLRGDKDGSGSAIGLVEQEGMRRARSLAASSDLVLAIISFESGGTLHLDPELLETISQLRNSGSRVHVVVNKKDLMTEAVSETDAHSAVQAALPGVRASFIACDPEHITEDGIPALLEALTREFAEMTTTDDKAGDEALGATARQRALLEECVAHLGLFLTLAEGGGGEQDLVLGAEHLRNAAGCLARITGRLGEQGDVEEVLGVVFEKFCVGK